MDQTFINWILAGFWAVAGFLLHAVWQEVKNLQASDKIITDRVAAIEILVAGDYVRREEMQAMVDALFRKLDKIEDKLDRKVDK